MNNLPPDGFADEDTSGPPDGFADEVQPAQPSMMAKDPGMIRRAWDAMAVPEKMSREGLGMMAEAVPSVEPTGNRFRDVALNTPKILAESVAETAPGFISRGSMATGGLLKAVRPVAKILKPVGRAIAKTAESASGLEYKTPGVLTQAFNDRRLITGRGTKEAGGLYDEMMDKGRIRPSFGRLKNEPLIDEALSAADDGTLTAEEALVARQTLDAIKRSYPRFSYKKIRDTFDAVAKTKSAEADAAFSRAVKSDALRQPLPVNKYGGTSIFKSSLAAIPGAAPLAAISPAVQGLTATGAGIAYRNAGRILKPLSRTPMRSGAIVGGIGAVLTEDEAKEYLKKARGNRSEARRMAIADGRTIPE